MKTRLILYFSFCFALLAAPLLQAEETGHNKESGAAKSEEHGEQHEGKRHGDFYPKKPADKRLSSRPEVVELLEPKALSQISGNQVTLKWKPAQNAEVYRVQVATDPNFKWLLKQEDFYKDTSYPVQGLEAGKTYYWRIYAMKLDNDTGWTSSFSSWSSFDVK